MDELIKAWQDLQRGGEWLSAARTWMQSNVPRGDTLTWSSGEPVSIPFCKLEELALRVASVAVAADRAERAKQTRYSLVQGVLCSSAHMAPDPQGHWMEAYPLKRVKTAIREGER